MNLVDFILDEDGQGMAEYAIIIGCIAIAAVVILVAMRSKIFSLFEKTNEAFNVEE